MKCFALTLVILSFIRHNLLRTWLVFIKNSVNELNGDDARVMFVNGRCQLGLVIS